MSSADGRLEKNTSFSPEMKPEDFSPVLVKVGKDKIVDISSASSDGPGSSCREEEKKTTFRPGIQSVKKRGKVYEVELGEGRAWIPDEKVAKSLFRETFGSSGDYQIKLETDEEDKAQQGLGDSGNPE